MIEVQNYKSKVDWNPTMLLKYLYYGHLPEIRTLDECLQLCAQDEYYMLGGHLKRLAELRLKQNFADA
jgi:hypothetical protein